MNDETLLSHLTTQLGDSRACCVAFSGGLDSTVLLHLLAALRHGGRDLPLRAVHIHHGLSRFADEWAAHCEALCAQWQIPLTTLRVTPDPRQGGVEAAARDARYQALASTLQPGETLLTAQHLDDQCETFLLALKRGSGPAGLSAMKNITTFHGHRLLRPLLDVSRQELEGYAGEQGLSWINDDSNQDDRFDRNFLRRQVLPVLHQRWPHFAAATSRSAALCAEQEALLDELLEETLTSLLDAQGSLAIEALRPMSEAKRAALLRRWMARHAMPMPAREQLQRLWREVAESRADAEPQLQLGGGSVRRFRQRLYLLPPMQEIDDQVLAWAPPTALTLPDGVGSLQVTEQFTAEKAQWIRRARPDEPVTVRFHAEGSFYIVGRPHSRQIKKLWQELAIPPWERNRTPLIFYGEHLIAAPGIFVTREGAASAGQPGWRVTWQKAVTYNVEEQA
ncbi:MAG: tRNA lysidine(34) synthetase TilS [Yersiniaceae bacterium]|nr:tRNA lysidine(34) synthetase TilS [Yersiniaceae bacterium]